MPMPPPMPTDRAQRCAECGTATDFGRPARRGPGLVAWAIAAAVVLALSLALLRTERVAAMVSRGTEERAVSPGYAPRDVAAIAAGKAPADAAERFAEDVRIALEPREAMARFDVELATFRFAVGECRRREDLVRGWPAAVRRDTRIDAWPGVADALSPDVAERVRRLPPLASASAIDGQGVVLLASVVVAAIAVAVEIRRRSSSARLRRLVGASLILLLVAVGLSALVETRTLVVSTLQPEDGLIPGFASSGIDLPPGVAMAASELRDGSPRSLSAREIADAIGRSPGSAEAPDSARLVVRIEGLASSGVVSHAYVGPLAAGRCVTIENTIVAYPAAPLATTAPSLDAGSLAMQWSSDGRRGWRLEIETAAIAAILAAILLVRGAVLALMHVLSRRRRRIASGKCPRCGYVVIPDLPQAPVAGGR
jgi:hypothetical protein